MAITTVVALTVAVAAALPHASGMTRSGQAAADCSETHPHCASARAAARKPVVRLRMDGGRKKAGDRVKVLRSSGTARVEAVVVRRNGGTAKRAPGRYRGWAVRLPPVVEGSPQPRAAIRVSSRGSRNPLSPGRSDFRFGADFRLNTESDDADGDNLVQRGAFGSRGQYKVQVDRGIALCRVKGSAGAILAQTDALERGRWHRVLCRRTGSTVTLRVWRLAAEGADEIASASGSGTIGAVRMPRSWPLSVGGRLRPNGSIPPGSNDQFNGVVDRVLYDLR